MNCCRLLLGLLLAITLVFSNGCGRPTLPGQHFQAERVQSGDTDMESGPLPDNPIREWGAAEADVQIEAYYPINKQHEELMALLKGLTEEYPGRVYVKYIDYRTGHGAALLSRSPLVGRGLTVNGKSRVGVEAEPLPYDVDFIMDMGRHWTAEDLEAVVAQAVEAASGSAPSAD